MDHWYTPLLLTFGPILAGIIGHWAGRQIGQPKTALAVATLKVGEIAVEDAADALLKKADPVLRPYLAQMINDATGAAVGQPLLPVVTSTHAIPDPPSVAQHESPIIATGSAPSTTGPGTLQ